MKNKKPNKTFIIRLTCGVVILSYIILAIHSYIFPYVPQFFPLNNPQGDYEITKGCPGAQGWNKDNVSSLINKDGYCVEYTGSGVLSLSDEKSNFYRISVGTSSQDLESFFNKNVIITSGQFVNADKQCVANHSCMSLGGFSTVLNIDSLKLKH